MKSDLDGLMKEKGLDAILVVGHAEHNPYMFYFVGGGHVSHAALIKKRGEEPVLFCNDMERDEASKSGLKVIPFTKYGGTELLKKANGNPSLKKAMDYQAMFREFGITKGRVGLYGFYDVGTVLSYISNFKTLMPEVELVGEEKDDSVIVRAMETKSPQDVERIRRMGRITTTVVGRVADYLTNCDVKDEVLLEEDGRPLTVAEVKSKINLWLSELGAENPEDCIFAIGHDAGVPHSIGKPEDAIVLGRTIVFDIFPCERGGGYFYDFTRTWSLGYASREAQKLYDQVHEAYNKVVENLDLNAPFKDYQRMTCEYYESKGHKTPLNTTDPIEGYVHSLGHGVGLNIHERPSSHLTAGDDNILKPGAVITIEPGLYYPDKGMGFRIEDTYWMNPNGNVERLAEYPYDFVLKMKKWKKN